MQCSKSAEEKIAVQRTYNPRSIILSTRRNSLASFGEYFFAYVAFRAYSTYVENRR